MKKHHERRYAESDTTSTKKPTRSQEVACSSSSALKVFRDFCNWAFLRNPFTLRRTLAEYTDHGYPERVHTRENG